MSKVAPGPLPNDGTRINIQNVMDTFVGGTRVFDLGPENFADTSVSFLVSQTEAPTGNRLTRGTLWYKRGEGVLYRWLPKPTSSGLSGLWVSASTRREMLIQARHPVTPGEILWSDPSPSEYRVHGSNEYLFTKVSGAEHSFLSAGRYTADSNATAAAHFEDMKLRQVPPFFVANESAAASDFLVVTELGFCYAQYTGATNARYGCMLEGSNVPYLTTLSSGFATETAVRVAHMVDSNPGAQQMLVYLHQGPSNLCR